MKRNKIAENKIKVPAVKERNPHVAFIDTLQISVFIMYWIQQQIRLKANQHQLLHKISFICGAWLIVPEGSSKCNLVKNCREKYINSLLNNSVGCCCLTKDKKQTKLVGTPNDEMCVGAAIAMTTDSTAHQEFQQRVSVCASIFLLRQRFWQ